MRKSNKRTPLFFYVGVLLLCVTMMSVHMSSGLYARYTSVASGDEASARVATFSYTGGSPQITSRELVVKVTPNVPIEYDFSFTNEGETAIRYTVSVENLSGNLPLLLEDITGIVEINGNETDTYTIGWESDKYDEEFSHMVDIIRMTVRIEQVD